MVGLGGKARDCKSRTGGFDSHGHLSLRFPPVGAGGLLVVVRSATKCQRGIHRSVQSQEYLNV